MEEDILPIQSKREDNIDGNISITALRSKTVDLISCLLNPTKVILTDSGLSRDWQGFAELAGINGQYAPAVKSETDKTAKIIQIWSQKNPKDATIQKFLEFLELLDRYDVIDDVKPLIIDDIKHYKDRQQLEVPAELEIDDDVLTNDDAVNLRNGGTLEKYHAFVLFDLEDIEFATNLIDTMEKQYKLKLCVPERDLLGGAPEHQAVTKLIMHRCNRLIVVVSPSFFRSPARTFFLSFGQAVGIEQRKRKIIPCVYEPCDIPQDLSCYHRLDYKSLCELNVNYWDKLYNSIVGYEKRPQIQRAISIPNRAITEKKTNPPANNAPLKKDANVKFKSDSNSQPTVGNGVVAAKVPEEASASPGNVAAEKKEKTKGKWKSKFLLSASGKHQPGWVSKCRKLFRVKQATGNI